MSKQEENKQGSEGEDTRPSFSEGDIAKARKCFERGQELAAKKSYDYAIEMYINGLGYWPEAVDEGHNPCRAAALFRGKAKIGFGGKMKYKTSGKDAKQCMLNAEMLLSKDPHNIQYMEELMKNAARACYDQTVMWIGEILCDAILREEKPNPARLILVRTLYEEVANRNHDVDIALAIAALDRAVGAQGKLHALKPTDMEISTDLRDLAGRLTILKGRYSKAESFRDSVRDTEAQAELHDKDRLVQSDERLDGLIGKAAAEYQARPDDHRAVNALVDLLTRRENEKDESKAIKILEKAYQRTNEYRHKLRADDIRMRQLNRKGRRLAAEQDREAVREHSKGQLRFELEVFKERFRQYPTDMRIRFEYGKRLFQTGQYDEAIPVLQEARNDPKARFQCSLYIGRCFFQKKYHSQAADTFREAIEAYEMADDELGKELHYWLGRSFEEDGKVEDALKTYGQLIQWDYNYRKGDVRKRIDDLKAKG